MMATIKEQFEYAFTPLPNTKPVSLLECTSCRWPVTIGGNTLFCDAPLAPSAKFQWCAEHLEMGVNRSVKINENHPRNTRSPA